MCRTYGARSFCANFPGLPTWANLCRAYGAGVRDLSDVANREEPATDLRFVRVGVRC